MFDFWIVLTILIWAIKFDQSFTFVDFSIDGRWYKITFLFFTIWLSIINVLDRGECISYCDQDRFKKIPQWLYITVNKEIAFRNDWRV